MRRLRDYQLVLLQAGETRVTAAVVAVGGDEAVLEPRAARDVAYLKLPLRCALIFASERHPVMLSGMADAGPVSGTLRFWVTDAVTVREMRLQPRLSSPFDVLVTPLDDLRGLGIAQPLLRTTKDISAGGALLLDHDAEPGSRMAIRMAVPGLGRPFDCAASVVRRCGADAAVRFERLDAELERTLGLLIFTLRQRVARRALERDPRAASWRDVA